LNRGAINQTKTINKQQCSKCRESIAKITTMCSILSQSQITRLFSVRCFYCHCVLLYLP